MLDFVLGGVLEASWSYLGRVLGGQDAPKTSQDGAKMGQDGAKMVVSEGYLAFARFGSDLIGFTGIWLNVQSISRLAYNERACQI